MNGFKFEFRRETIKLSVESNPGLNWFCFTVLFDWSRKLAPPSQPIRCKQKPIAPWSLAFSRATGRLDAFTSSCHWLPLIISFTLIGRCDYFSFGFRHSIEKRPKAHLIVCLLIRHFLSKIDHSA